MFHAILAWPSIDEIGGFHRVSEELMAGTVRLTMSNNLALVTEVKAQWPQLAWASIEARARKPKSSLGYLKNRLSQTSAHAVSRHPPL